MKRYSDQALLALLDSLESDRVECGAYIQFLRIDGTDLADPVIDEENISGAIVEMLRRTEEKLKAHNRVAVNLTSADGAIGSHANAVQDAKKDFRLLAGKIAEKIGVQL